MLNGTHWVTPRGYNKTGVGNTVSGRDHDSNRIEALHFFTTLRLVTIVVFYSDLKHTDAKRIRSRAQYVISPLHLGLA